MMPTMAKSEVIITKHAIERYADRVLHIAYDESLDEQIKFVIMQMLPDTVLSVNKMQITRDGVTYVFKGRTITTIYAKG